MLRIWAKFYQERRIVDSVELPNKVLPWFLKNNSWKYPNKPAIVFYGKRITFKELDELAGRFAAALEGSGIKKGDRVGIFLQNSPQFIISYFSALRLGAILVAMNPMCKEIELEYELNNSGTKVLVTDDQLYPVVRNIRDKTKLEKVIVTSYQDYLSNDLTLPVPASFKLEKKTYQNTHNFKDFLNAYEPISKLAEVDLEDIALIQYTSGTTGQPKGAVINHSNIMANLIATTKLLAMTDKDINLAVLPLFHVSGMMNSMNLPLYLGNTIILIGRFDIETVLKAIERYKATMTLLIVTANLAIIDYPEINKYDLSSLRYTLSGGDTVPANVARRWEEITGHKLIEGYGLSETISPTHINLPDRPKYGSFGIPIPGTDAKVVDLETGTKELPVGEAGELIVKGPQIMKGYWNNSEATKEALRDGWLYTGDIARMDDEGYFYFVARKKDMIKCSGYSVFPAEIESIIYKHPAIKEVAVIGVPDPYRGESPKAFITFKPGYKGKVTEEEIIDWCKKNMAAYKYPRKVEFVEALPKSASGKVLKRVLGEREKG